MNLAYRASIWPPADINATGAPSFLNLSQFGSRWLLMSIIITILSGQCSACENRIGLFHHVNMELPVRELSTEPPALVSARKLILIFVWPFFWLRQKTKGHFQIVSARIDADQLRLCKPSRLTQERCGRLKRHCNDVWRVTVFGQMNFWFGSVP